MDVMTADAFDAYNQHCDELATLVDEREDALKASAAAYAKMHESTSGLTRSIFVFGGLTASLQVVVLAALLSR